MSKTYYTGNVTVTGNIDTSNKDVTVYRLNHVDDMWLEVAMEEEETQKNGLAVIVDMEGYSVKLFRWLTPQNIRISSHKLYVSCSPFPRPRRNRIFHMSVRV
jgi:hypothetical protein